MMRTLVMEMMLGPGMLLFPAQDVAAVDAELWIRTAQIRVTDILCHLRHS